MCHQDAAIAQAARIASEAIVLAVDSDSIGDVVGELLRGLEDSAPGCRAAAANLAGFFFKAAQADLEEHLPVILGVQRYCQRLSDGARLMQRCVPLQVLSSSS